MNIKTLKAALPYMFQAKIVPLLWGHHGIGKSSSVKSYCEENSLEFIDLRLGQMETGDLLGLPEIVKDKNGNAVTVFARPKWFPTEGKGILFLDEINRARLDVIQAVFQLVLDRKMHDYELPEGWNVVAAANPDTSNYRVLDFSDKALADRFVHIKLTTTHVDFLDYAKEKGLHQKMLGFINHQPSLLQGNVEEFDMKFVEPSARSWEKVSQVLFLEGIPEGIQNELISGLVGTEASIAYLTYLSNKEKPVEGAIIVNDYKSVKDKIVFQSKDSDFKADLINETKESVLKHLSAVEGKVNDSQYANVIDFANDLPNDTCIDLLRRLIDFKEIFIKMIEEESLTKKLEGYQHSAGKLDGKIA